MSDRTACPPRVLGHFREILLWPLQLMPLRENSRAFKVQKYNKQNQSVRLDKNRIFEKVKCALL